MSAVPENSKETLKQEEKLWFCLTSLWIQEQELLSSLPILQPCSRVEHKTSTIIIFSTNSSLCTTRCNSARGRVLLWVLAVFFSWVEKITLLLLNLCHSFTVAVSYATTHSRVEQVQARSLVAVKMHFIKCRKTVTEVHQYWGEVEATKEFIEHQILLI